MTGYRNAANFEEMLLRTLYLLAAFLACICGKSFAADTLRSIPIKAHYLTTDESGNAYVVRNDNILIRYNEAGDSTGFYNSVLNGEIGSVDALNPLRIFVFYPDYSRIVWLDRTMNPQAEADLKRLNIPSGAIAAPSSDNAIWVYDSYSATLRKINESGEVQRTSNDLRQQLGFVPEGIQLIERERKVFLVDSSRGVLVFDQFGSYLSTLTEKGIKQIQVIGESVYFLKDSLLQSYHLSGYWKSQIFSGPFSSLAFSFIAHKIIDLSKNRLTWLLWRPLIMQDPPR